MASTMLQSSRGPHYIGSDLIASAIETSKVPNTKTVTALALSPEGKYLAIGDSTGRVTLRCMHLSGKRFPLIFNAGKGVGITALLWLRSTTPWTLFMASGNGYLNCIAFDGGDPDHDSPRNTGVKAPGHISCLAVNDDESQLAVSYDYTTKVYPLPFEEGDPVKLGKSAGRLVNQDFPGFKWHLTPVREHPRALSLHYLDKNTLCVAFFRKIEAYDTTPESGTKQKLWSIAAPDGTYIGACAVSPSRKLIATTNLGSGWDWFSTHTRTWMSETKVEDTYKSKNQILPIAFLSENTVAAGHNLGQLMTGSNGVVATKPLGRTRGDPSQYLTISRSPGKILIVYACGMNVIANTITLSGEPAPDLEHADLVSTTVVSQTPSPTPSLVRQSHPPAAIPETPIPLDALATASTPALPIPPPPEPPALTLPVPSRPRPSVTFDLTGTSSHKNESSIYDQYQTPAETPSVEKLLGVQQARIGVPATGQDPGSVAMPLRGTDREFEPTSLIDLEDDYDSQRETRAAGIKFELLSGWRDNVLSPSRSISPIKSTPPSSDYNMTVSVEGPPSPLEGKGPAAHRPRTQSFTALRAPQEKPVKYTTGTGFGLESTTVQARRDDRYRHRPSRRMSRSRSPEGDDDRDGFWTRSLMADARENPKYLLLVFFAVMVVLLAVRSSTPTHEFGLQTKAQEGQPRDMDAVDEQLPSAEVTGDDMEDGYEEGCDTVVLTETKVLTVTRTVTNTATVTTTVLSHATANPKRSHKGHRDRRR